MKRKKAGRTSATIDTHAHWYPREFISLLQEGAAANGAAMDRRRTGIPCLPQAGGTFPWLVGRFDRGLEVRKELKHMKRKPTSYLRRFYYDTIMICFPSSSQ